MTDPTPHDAGAHDLRELLEQVAASIDPPPVPPSDDLDRGRRRLRRRRTAIAAAAVAGVVVVSAGSAALATRSGGTAAPAPATASTATDTPTPTPTSTPSPVEQRDAKQLLTDEARVVGEYLDPRGTHLDLRVTGVQSSGAGLGTKLGWTNAGESGLGEVQFFVSDGWRTQFDFYCNRFTPCQDVVIDGVHARRQTVDGVTSIGVEHPDGSVAVLRVDALFGNNSTVAVSGIDVTPAQLAHAAADPRLVAPTRAQIAGVDEAFGWPSLPPVGGPTRH